MPSVLDLRRRIRSVRNTRQITKAMKMVAAAKLRRAQERMTQARPYAVMLASVLASARRRAEGQDAATNALRSPLLARREEKTVLLVLISGDKGFAGAFSTNIVRAGTQFVRKLQAEDGGRKIDIEAVGRKGRDFFRRRYATARFEDAREEGARPNRTRSADVEVVASELSQHLSLDRIEYEDVRLLGEEIAARFAAEEVDAVYLAYNSFQSVISQKVVVERVLPLVEAKEGIADPQVEQENTPTAEERRKAGEAALSAGLTLRDEEREAIEAQRDDEAKRFGTAEVDYTYDQPADEVYQALLPRFVSALLFHAMLESVASEHAARMTAMDAATNNASELIDSLTLTMNRVRQAAITKEIIEIVSGAAAV